MTVINKVPISNTNTNKMTELCKNAEISCKYAIEFEIYQMLILE